MNLSILKVSSDNRKRIRYPKSSNSLNWVIIFKF